MSQGNNLCHDECHSIISSTTSCRECLYMNSHSKDNLLSVLNSKFNKNQSPDLENNVRALQTNCYDQNCANCTKSPSTCNKCNDSYELQNNMCVQYQSSSSPSMLMIIIGIVVPIAFTIVFCIM